MGYSVQPRGQIFVKSYQVLSFAKRIAKTISKNLSAKYSHKVFDHAKQSETHALKTSSKRVIQKTTEATDDLIGNKTSNRITKVSKCSPQNIQEQLQMKMMKKSLKKDIYLQTEKNCWIIFLLMIMRRTIT